MARRPWRRLQHAGDRVGVEHAFRYRPAEEVRERIPYASGGYRAVLGGDLLDQCRNGAAVNRHQRARMQQRLGESEVVAKAVVARPPHRGLLVGEIRLDAGGKGFGGERKALLFFKLGVAAISHARFQLHFMRSGGPRRLERPGTCPSVSRCVLPLILYWNTQVRLPLARMRKPRP